MKRLTYLGNTNNEFIPGVQNPVLSISSLSVCDLALFNLFMSSVFFPYALFKMQMTLLKHTFQYGGQEQEAAKGL